MDWVINLGAKISGIWKTINELLPLLGAVGGLLGVGSSIAIRASQAGNAAALLHALSPTPEEYTAAAISIGLFKSHFNHIANAKIIDVHTAQIASDTEIPAPLVSTPPAEHPAA